MNGRTRLEEALSQNNRYTMAGGMGATAEQLQRILDRIAPEICASLTTEVILEHMKTVYDETTPYYASLPDHRNITDSLLTFMNLPQLREGSCVLDLGCGPLVRDTQYMSWADEKFRVSFMARQKDGRPLRERMPIPSHSFRVMAVDGSRVVIRYALGTLMFAQNLIEDPHVKKKMSVDILEVDMHDLSSLGTNAFDGVWASASLFTHTPRALIKPAFQSVKSVLKAKGVFAVSYPARKDGGSYDNLLYSRSGRVKYFSHPTPTEISTIAEELNFFGIGDELSDHHRGGEIMKNFFITQFFQKA